MASVDDRLSMAEQKRSCPVCGESERFDLVVEQRFVIPTKNGVYSGYDVVVCARCGFGFARNPPAQSFFDAYYHMLAKKGEMLDASAAFAESPTTIARNAHSYKNIVPHVRPESRVLEVGCYTGYLLSLIEGGVPGVHVVGLDPSAFAAQVGRTRRGIDIRVGSIFDDVISEPCDVVVVIHVLEHVVDLRAFLGRLRGFLVADGVLYLEVPDAARFSLLPNSRDPAGGRTEPYLEFNFEHINYFTRTSLTNLMRSNGFEPLVVEQQDSTLPVIASTWTLQRLEKAEDSLAELRRYAADCGAATEPAAARIRRLVASGVEFAVWGAGPHTQRFLATGDLDPARVRFFIDSNPDFRDAELAGRPVCLPEILNDNRDLPILISSYRFEEEIAANIRARGWMNRLILLYAAERP